MKIATFTQNGFTRIGKVFDQELVDLSVALPQLPQNLLDVLRSGDAALNQIRAVSKGSGPGVYPLAAIKLEAPILNPSKYLAIGMNYREHAAEAERAGVPIPTSQLWFNKQVSCVNGPYDSIELPKISEKLDYEAELGVVIGKRCKHVRIEDAQSVIGGYLVTNDVSIRDWQMRSPTFTLGKSFDTHGPIGPWLTTSDEIPDPHNLMMSLYVGKELRQQTNTGDMIYNIFEQIAYLSTVMTLEPGDLIATGTPSGVGVAKKPPQYLRAGEVVRVEIDGLGYIENTVVAEV